jgi:hypothetical protein
MPCRRAIPNTSGDGAFYNFPVGLWRFFDIHGPHLQSSALSSKKAGCIRRSAQSTFEAPKPAVGIHPSGAGNRPLPRPLG